ncbi:MAG: CsgG/HfaB family protein, partial [Planctomycetaceae bacterium]|nr:CsgG/HfaB family protein [Planctomycetaceae bacterium]
MGKYLQMMMVFLIFLAEFVHAATPRLAIISGGDPKPNELLVLAEAKLFDNKGVELLERLEIDKVLAEQKLSGLFNTENAIELGQILKVDLFAVLETTSITVFDAKTGLRFVDETLPEELDKAAGIVADAVKTATEKQQKFANNNLITFGVLEIRNADFPVDRDTWCKAMSSLLERSLLHRGAAVLERSRLQHVNKERQLTGNNSNELLASMKLIDLELTRGTKPKSFRITARVGGETFRAEGLIEKPLETIRELAGKLLNVKEINEEINNIKEASRFLEESRFLRKLS